MPTITPPDCPKCQAVLKEMKAKNGALYFACPNWKPNSMGCEGYQWFPPKDSTTGRNGIPRTPSTAQTKDKITDSEILSEILTVVRQTHIQLAELAVALDSFLGEREPSSMQRIADKRNEEQHGVPPPEWGG